MEWRKLSDLIVDLFRWEQAKVDEQVSLAYRLMVAAKYVLQEMGI